MMERGWGVRSLVGKTEVKDVVVGGVFVTE